MIMDPLLLFTMSTSVLALALALGMGALLVRLLREERRRTDARIAALTDAAGQEPIDEGRRSMVDGRTAKHEERRARIVEDLEIRPVLNAPAVGELFAEPERSSPWGRRIAAAAGIALIVAAAGYVLTSRDGSMVDEGAAAAPVEAVAQPAPLELLSLRHTQQADSLTITGLVQNPRGGAALSRVTATAFLFSADGTFLASGRAPLDFSTIGPGDESPFVVTVTVAGPVGRYRVGFRGEDGRVIAHVDRRTNGTIASR